MINKPFNQIEAPDIEDLFDHGGTHESSALEFKSELSRRDGKQPDPWMIGESRYSNHARDELFREIVAFANSRGGTLVLGIDEAEDNPPRASKITPIPEVYDLAARLEDAARSCIEPPLGNLQIKGIETELGSGRGVVLFRTVASPFGPHRVMGDGHAYIRRGTSSVKMTMREIQDLTIDLARGADRLDSLFQNRAVEFAKWFLEGGTVAGIRVTAAPIGVLPRSLRIGRREDISFVGQFRTWFENGSSTRIVCPGLDNPSTRPTLRGRRAFYEADDRSIQVDILDNGIVDLWFRCRITDHSPHLYSDWVLGSSLTVMKLVDWFRQIADAPEWQYAIELELQQRGDKSVIVIEIPTGFKDTIAVSSPFSLPRISWQSSSEEEEMVNLIFQDILDAGGHHGQWPRITFTDPAATIKGP